MPSRRVRLLKVFTAWPHAHTQSAQQPTHARSAAGIARAQGGASAAPAAACAGRIYVGTPTGTTPADVPSCSSHALCCGCAPSRRCARHRQRRTPPPHRLHRSPPRPSPAPSPAVHETDPRPQPCTLHRPTSLPLGSKAATTLQSSSLGLVGPWPTGPLFIFGETTAWGPLYARTVGDLLLAPPRRLRNTSACARVAA